ncbi:radical SAM protein, partial [Kitasatospora sp. NPDC056783]|uniref:radical SAM protein n=1 Tax=Kitasatospora sp. NPDC056783 TaxID=3345943 RepID=UPI003689E08F
GRNIFPARRRPLLMIDEGVNLMDFQHRRVLGGNEKTATLYDAERMTLVRAPRDIVERALRYAHLGHGELEVSEADRESWARIDAALQAGASPIPPAAGEVAISKLIIGNTYHCNMGCSYCYNELDVKDRKGSEVPTGMSEETALASIDALFNQNAATGRFSIVFVGGEPLLEKPVLYRAVDYARERAAREEKKIDFSVYTNGTLMNKEVIKWAGENRVSLVVSLDGPPVLNDKHRVYLSGRPTSKAVLRNIRKLVESGTQDVLRVRAVAAENTPLVALHQYLLDLGFNEIHVQPAYGEDGIAAGSTEDESLALLEWYRKSLLAGTIVSVMPFEGFIERILMRGRATASWYPCSAGRTALGVGPDGEIYPCHHFLEEGTFSMGNVRRGLPLLNDRAPFFQRVDEREPCNSCWARHACGGECYHRAHTGGAGYTGVLPDTCHRRKGLIGLTLEVLAELVAANPSALKRVLNKQYSTVVPNEAAYEYKDLTPYLPVSS